MIIKTRSILDSEVSILVDFGKIEISSSLRADIVHHKKIYTYRAVSNWQWRILLDGDAEYH